MFWRAGRTVVAVLAVAMASVLPAVGQTQGDTDPENRFLLTGYGFTTYVDSDAEGGTESFNAGFVPIFLYQVGEKFLVEVELEFEFEDDELETEVEYAQIDWLANDYLTVVAGKYLTPFGSFIERLHPAWINKLPTFPLPYQHGQSVVPFSQTGLQLRGGVPLGDGLKRFTYSAYVSNGFQVSAHGHGAEEGEDDHDEEGEDDHEEETAEMLTSSFNDEDGHDEDGGGHEGEEHEDEDPIFLDGSSFNGNGDLAFGGRVSLIPARGFEIGVSYLSGSYDEEGLLDTETFGVDFTYHHDLFDLRGEWLDSDIERGVAEDGDPLNNQQVESWYIQPSLRLSVIPAYVFNKLELVARYANLDFGETDQDQTSVGLNYYFSGSTILRVAWERLEETGHASDDSLNVMLAIGF